MHERYPDDSTLLALTQDPHTGLEYIPTGRSPYYLEFRRLVHRLLLAAARANDLRVYQDGELTIGVRPGRCFIGGEARDFTGESGVAVSADATTHVWLDADGALTTGTSGLPADRTACVPLARITTGATAITELLDLRGEAFLNIPSLSSLGLDVTAAQVNAVLNGVNPTVDAAALNLLTGGPMSTADSEHRHLQVAQHTAGEAYFVLLNTGSGPGANAALALSVPNVHLDDLVVLRHPDNGYLCQRLDTATYSMVGVVHAQFGHDGALTASLAGKLMGVVPVSGEVSAVVLSVGTNLSSSQATDGVEAVAKVNGAALTTTHPKITSAAGTGFRSTARGHGTASVIKTDGTQNVIRGDVLTVDLTRTAAGTVSTEAANVVALVVIRANQPE